MSALAIRFLGAGNATAHDTGSSSCVLELDGRPSLLVDCGHDTLARYADAYAGATPRAVFVTHVHLDHVAGLEPLFFRAVLDESLCGRIRIYVPHLLVAALHSRLALAPLALAEGGANFWDAFQLVPVGDELWHQGLLLQVFATRHHGYRNAFGIALPGAFVYTGDTRPVPEVLAALSSHGEIVFHDCAGTANPSHTGLDELAECYPQELRARMVLYHYEGEHVARRMEAAGYRVARPGQRFVLGHGTDPDPLPDRSAPLPSRVVGL